MVETPEAGPARNGNGAGVLPQTGWFIRANALAIVAISALVLVPCFWHRLIEACDLDSHVYNAWLAHLIAHGQAPGLYIVRQWNNVLFDLWLYWAGSAFGWAAGEKIAVSCAVLVFFWGTFALMAAASRRAPWFLVPAIAMIAYGWTFNIGFFDYYLSVGLAFCGAALLWRGRGAELLWVFVVAALAFLAHPLGLVCLVGLGAYVKLSERLPARLKLLGPLAAACALYAARVAVTSRYPVRWMNAPIPISIVNGLNGVDQLALGARYATLAISVFVLGMGSFALDAVRRRARWADWRQLSIPLELYGIAILATALLPDTIFFPHYTVPFGFLLMRLSLISAALALCVLACLEPKKWHLAAFGLAAMVFFAMMCGDTGKIDRMEQQAEQLVRQIPAGQRVTATIWPLPGSRLYFINHIVDQACVGRCFSYSNFEPSSGAFRVRVRPGSPVVASSPQMANELQIGSYVVKPEDLPLTEIYQCSPDMTRLCMQPLHAGEPSGAPALQPAH